MINFDNNLKNAWIKQLLLDWNLANYYYFKRKMRSPVIDLLSSKKVLGKWSSSLRQLSISEHLIKNYSWQYVQEVLFHEMAHQYVDEILHINDCSPHNEYFIRVCRENSIDHRASGEIKKWIDNKRENTIVSSGQKILNKIHKLFSLAKSPNQHEAESAMVQAQRLLLKYNIAITETQENIEHTHKQIGKVGNKNPIKSMIGGILSNYFFVKTIWVFGFDQWNNKTGRILEIYGTLENVKMGEYVYHYLENITEVIWKEYKKKAGLKGNKHRRTYIYGLLAGFEDKLASQYTQNQAESLIWIGDPMLEKFYKRRNPKIVNSKYSYSKSCDDTYSSGLAMGKKIIIHKGMTTNGKNRLANLKYLES